MSVLFIDFGPQANKNWDQLWDNAAWERWSDGLEDEVANQVVIREGQPVRLLVHHAEDGRHWDALQGAVNRALMKGLRPPCALKVSSVSGRGQVSTNALTCVSAVAVPSNRDLSHLRARFHRLVEELLRLANSTLDAGDLFTAWRIWNENYTPSPERQSKHGGSGAPSSIAPLTRSTFGKTLISVGLLARTWMDAQDQGEEIRRSVNDPAWWWCAQSLPPSANHQDVYANVGVILKNKTDELARQKSSPQIAQAVEACAALSQFFVHAANASLDRDLVEAMLESVATSHQIIAHA